MNKNHLLRHLLETLRYRTAKPLKDVPEGFGDFEAGQGVRTPAELMRHMAALMVGTSARIRDEEWEAPGPADLETLHARFEQGIDDLSALLATTTLETSAELKVLQGPVADAMTHAGQLAMLRRLAGSSVRGENFMAAPISVPSDEPHQEGAP